MNSGQLVKWSLSWLAGCTNETDERIEQYRNQIGVVIGKSWVNVNCWMVVWHDGQKNDVHREYLETI